jgi:hypothetical protein
MNYVQDSIIEMKREKKKKKFNEGKDIVWLEVSIAYKSSPNNEPRL